MLYKIPYFDIENNELGSLDKEKVSNHEIICVCPNNSSSCNNGDQGGFKYSFSYQAQPTTEPVSYGLKGYKQNANLTYNDIGVDIHQSVIDEITLYIDKINALYTIPVIAPQFYNHLQNSYNNQQLDNKIFQKINRYDQKDEVYYPYDYLENICVNLTISSQIYIINANYDMVTQ